VAERDTPPVGPRDVLVAVAACGVCGSDVASFLHGHYVSPGQVMGHESVGVVVEAGAEVAHVDAGDRVVVRPLRACGDCWYCRRGEGHICGSTAAGSLGYGAEGAFADLLLIRDEVRGRQLVPIAEETPTEEAVWAEPLAVALHALARAGIQPGDRVLVLGAGPIGLALTAGAHAGGAVVEVVEPRAARREAALAVGAARAVAPDGSADAADRVTPSATDAAPGDAPFDAVLDASGAPAAIAAGCARLAPGGTLVLVGLGDGALPPLPPGIRVRGAFAFTPRDFLRSARLIESRAVRLADAVSHSFPLHETGRAIETAAHDAAALKVIVRPQPDIEPDRGTEP
jgi:2-desacetyl-2-hydroxyethyl bacteriochlorophyllide A dehydrogenase